MGSETAPVLKPMSPLARHGVRLLPCSIYCQPVSLKKLDGFNITAGVVGRSDIAGGGIYIWHCEIMCEELVPHLGDLPSFDIY